VLALLRFHLVNNVLAFHDVYLQRQHRPTLAEGLSHYQCGAAHIKQHIKRLSRPLVLPIGR